MEININDIPDVYAKSPEAVLYMLKLVLGSYALEKKRKKVLTKKSRAAGELNSKNAWNNFLHDERVMRVQNDLKDEYMNSAQREAGLVIRRNKREAKAAAKEAKKQARAAKKAATLVNIGAVGNGIW